MALYIKTDLVHNPGLPSDPPLDRPSVEFEPSRSLCIPVGRPSTYASIGRLGFRISTGGSLRHVRLSESRLESLMRTV